MKSMRVLAIHGSYRQTALNIPTGRDVISPPIRLIENRVGRKSPVGGKNHGKFRFLPSWTLSYGINWQKLKTINICNIKIYL